MPRYMLAQLLRVIYQRPPNILTHASSTSKQRPSPEVNSAVYLECRVAQKNRPLYLQVGHDGFKVAHNYRLVAFQVALPYARPERGLRALPRGRAPPTGPAVQDWKSKPRKLELWAPTGGPFFSELLLTDLESQ